MPVTQADIDLAHRLADAAGNVIRPYFRHEHGVEIKDDQSPVTRADREAEAAMRRLLDAERSGDGIVGEEYGEKPGITNRKWVLDPIDGTRSFTVGRAIFGTLDRTCRGWLAGARDHRPAGPARTLGWRRGAPDDAQRRAGADARVSRTGGRDDRHHQPASVRAMATCRITSHWWRRSQAVIRGRGRCMVATAIITGCSRAGISMWCVNRVSSCTTSPRLVPVVEGAGGMHVRLERRPADGGRAKAMSSRSAIRRGWKTCWRRCTGCRMGRGMAGTITIGHDH